MRVCVADSARGSGGSTFIEIEVRGFLVDSRSQQSYTQATDGEVIS